MGEGVSYYSGKSSRSLRRSSPFSLSRLRQQQTAKQRSHVRASDRKNERRVENVEDFSASLSSRLDANEKKLASSHDGW